MAVSRGKIKLNNFKGNNDVIELKQLKVTFVRIVAKHFEILPLKCINETVNC